MRGNSSRSGKMRDGQEAWSRSLWLRYGVALASVAIAAVVRALLDHVLGPHAPFVTFSGAIALAMWFGGWGPGLIAVILGLVTADFFFIAPRYTLFQEPSLTNVIGNLSYCGVGLIICVAGRALHRAKSRAETSTASLREGEKRFADIVGLAMDAIITIDSEQRIVMFNGAAEKMFRCSATEAIGSSLDRFIPERHRAAHAGHVRRFAQSSESSRTAERREAVSALRADGEKFRLEASISKTEVGGTTLFTAILRDVTERKALEDALRESEQRFHTLANNMSQLSWMADSKGWIFWYNQRWLDYTGRTLKEMQGWGWKKVHHPDHVNRVLTRIQQSWDTGDPWEDTFPLRGKDGQYRWFLSRALPVRDGNGEVRWFGTNTDVTDLREAQEALLAARDDLTKVNVGLEAKVLERTSKLRETIGELEALSYGIIHDLRAPLRAMHTCAQYLAEECGASVGAEGHDYIQRIMTSSNRMDKLVQDVLTYSEVIRTELKLEAVNTDQLLRGILDSYPQLCENNADVQIEGKLPTLLANEAALTQCVSGLLSNAVKFVAPGICPRVRIGAEALDQTENLMRSVGSSTGTCWMRLWVQDNGIGIDREYWGQIFQMFQRLDKRYPGTGIGLPVVRKAAERMGGKVGFESDPGKGSRFWIELRSADTTFANDPLPRTITGESFVDSRTAVFASTL